MIIVKNTFGISASMNQKAGTKQLISTLGGSSLNRTKKPSKQQINDHVADISQQPSGLNLKKKEKKLRSMSSRTKGKIRKKLIAFARIHKNLSFLTLTFVNAVTDRTAIEALRVFLDNAKKRSKDFQYLWVAERQTKNTVFENNIHFHLITNKFWKLDKWWQYWLDVQARFGIIPRDAESKPSSAFDVRHVSSNNIKGIVNYLTKYVTKNEGEFDCQVWNCSKKISQLYTEFYSGLGFIRHLEALEKAGQLGGELKMYPKEYCNIHIVPLNRLTMNLYNRIDERNRAVWKGQLETPKTIYEKYI